MIETNKKSGSSPVPDNQMEALGLVYMQTFLIENVILSVRIQLLFIQKQPVETSNENGVQSE